jgi:hypothetical protein
MSLIWYSSPFTGLAISEVTHPLDFASDVEVGVSFVKWPRGV